MPERPTPPPLHRAVHGVGKMRARYHHRSELQEDIERAERINDRLYTWAITIAVTMMGVAILMTLCTHFIDGKLAR